MALNEMNKVGERLWSAGPVTDDPCRLYDQEANRGIDPTPRLVAPANWRPPALLKLVKAVKP